MTAADRTEKSSAIRAKRRGNSLGIWFFEIMLRAFGLKGAYGLLHLVCLHYLLFDREAVAAGMTYVEKRFPGSGVLQNYRHVYRLFVNQGRQLIDRYVIAGKPDYFQYEQISTDETLHALQESTRGVVLLTSHAGNWQVALRQMGHLKKRICLVMRPEDNPALRDSLQLGGLEAKPVKVIDPLGHLGGVLEMMQALGEGDVVCIMGDRAYGFDTLEVPFLGEPAYFPYGAFLVAAAAECPVLALLTHKISERAYIADISNMWYPVYGKGKSKREQLSKWLGNYVSLLETFVEKHPYECFLFHNVWAQEGKGA